MDSTLRLTDGPILDDPELLGLIPDESKLKLNAALDKAIERMEAKTLDKLREQETQLTERHDAALVLAAREQTSAVIKAHIDGIPATGVENMQAREKLQDLRMSALTGTDEQKDNPWHLQTAGEIVRLHQEERRKNGGDGAQRLPDLGLSDIAPGSNWGRGYNLDRMLLSLAGEVKDKGSAFDIDNFTGSPEAEMTKEIAAQPFAREALAELRADARPGSRIIPIPAAALRADTLRLGETYAEAVATATKTAEPDYRRDLLVHFFRPIDRLMFLGVMEEIDLQQHHVFPGERSAGSATWKAENADATETQLTLVTKTTAPHRLTTYDDVSWQRLVGADRDFGVVPLVSQELMRACRQAREKAFYQGSGASNQPTGIQNITGVLAAVIGGADGNTTPTYKDLIGILVDIADGDIPIDMLRWVTTWAAGGTLATALTFASSSSLFAVPLYRASDMGVGMGTLANFPACLTTQLPTDLNSGAETADDEHAIIAGVFPYSAVADYATMFITIDDISQAGKGLTRMTVNSYHDVFERVPGSKSFGEFKP